MYSSAENTRTPAIIGSIVAHALRSLILLYRYVHRQISIWILGAFHEILLVPPDLLMAAPAAILLKRAAIAAIIRVVVQPDGDTVAPDPVDLGIEREILLPAANRDSVIAALRHGGVVKADRGALLQEAGVGCSPTDVAVEGASGLQIGESHRRF